MGAHVELGHSGKSTTGTSSWFDGTQPCAQTDPEIFFPEPTTPRSVLKVARDICRSCDFQAPCLEFAIRTRSTGIWGGTTERERRKYKLPA
jgi:WhiB family redox-sensing transcriptional regulator